MFWGLITEPNKRYTQVVEKPFHISQAAMDISTGDNDPCQVMVVVEGKNYLVCTLQKGKCIQVPLDLYFRTGESLSFLTNGKANIHLTGYLDPEFDDEPSEEEESGEEEEEDQPTLAAKLKRKLENSIDGSASKKSKQDKKAQKKAANGDSSDSDEDSDEDQLQKLLDGEDVDTDENDESFKVNTTMEESGSDEDSDDDDEEGEEEEDEDDDDDEEDDDNDVSSEKADTSMDTSKDDSKIDMSKLSKSQKKRLRKKQKEQQPQTNGIDKSKKDKQPEQKADKKKQDKKQEPKKGQEVGEKKEKKSLSGGVFIEDLKVGTGPVAKPGKTVMVHYEGRLKQNNKVFDNCLKGPGFKFKLGSKEVISGWDVGVAGMKVGGKRKIVCPPAMGYGAKGSPPVIPPNSTLVFEVELKNIK